MYKHQRLRDSMSGRAEAHYLSLQKLPLATWLKTELRYKIMVSQANKPFYSCLFIDLALNGSEAGGDLVLIKTSLFC